MPADPRRPTFSVDPSKRASRRLITMSKIEPPKTRALRATFSGGRLPPGARMPRSCSTVPPSASSAQIWWGSVRLQHQGVRHRVQAARGRAHSASFDLRRDGRRRCPPGTAGFPRRRCGWRRCLHPVLACVHRGIDLLLLRPEGDVAREIHARPRSPSEISAAPRSDVAQVVHGDDHVPASAGHPARRGAERGGLRRGSGEEGVPVLVLGIGDGEQLSEELVHLLSDVAHLVLVQRAVGALHAQLADALEDVHGAAQVRPPRWTACCAPARCSCRSGPSA